MSSDASAIRGLLHRRLHVTLTVTLARSLVLRHSHGFRGKEFKCDTKDNFQFLK